uniref:Uncharacterized protein n=1 Tax=Sphaerodactylus townsendi TaxID=933632 RepID=A0ACB8ERA6_9SAUR
MRKVYSGFACSVAYAVNLLMAHSRSEDTWVQSISPTSQKEIRHAPRALLSTDPKRQEEILDLLSASAHNPKVAAFSVCHLPNLPQSPSATQRYPDDA